MEAEDEVKIRRFNTRGSHGLQLWEQIQKEKSKKKKNVPKEILDPQEMEGVQIDKGVLSRWMGSNFCGNWD